MAISNRVRRRLEVALASKLDANELVDVIETPTFTSGDISIWVDAVNGSDDIGIGDQAHPFRSINRAMREIPHHIRHSVTVHLKAGTYKEDVTTSFHIEGEGSLVIAGEAWKAVTPATGYATGSIASVSGNTLTVNTAGWTVNDLRGKFVEITSGTKTGDRYPINSNTATTLEVGIYGAAVANASFRFVESEVILTGDPNTAEVPMLVLNNEATYLEWSSNGAFIKDLKIVNDETKWYGILVNGGSTIFDHVVVIAGAYIRAFQGELPYKNLTLSYCYVQASASYSSIFEIRGSGSTNIICSVLRGTYIYFEQQNLINFTDSIVECTGGTEIRDYCGLWLHDTLLKGSTVYGIRALGSHNTIGLNGYARVTGNTGVGVLLFHLVASHHNALELSTTASMTSNGGGDIKYGTAAAVTTANVAGATNKVLTDAAFLNTVMMF